VTIKDAIDKLTFFRQKHGDVEVYFDCQSCGKSFTPNTVVGAAVHLSEEPKRAPGTARGPR
jgi:hypothetical protein